MDKEYSAQRLELGEMEQRLELITSCLLYTSDAADEGLGVDLGGRRIIKKLESLRQINS